MRPIHIIMNMRLKHVDTNSLWSFLPNSRITQQTIINTNPITENKNAPSQPVNIAKTPIINMLNAHPINIDTKVLYIPTKYVLLSPILTGFNRIYEKKKYIKLNVVDDNFINTNHSEISHIINIIPNRNAHPKVISNFCISFPY